MAFIRTKKIKGAEYAYLVENQYRKRGNRTKQKCKKYLGRVYRHGEKLGVDFIEHYKIQDVEEYLNIKDKKEIISDVVKLELFNYGFVEKGKKWIKDELVVDLSQKKVSTIKGKKVALAFNDGFLTTHALRKIHNFRAFDQEEGYDFAKMFIEAGINIPSEVFVGVFSKILE